MEVALGYLRDDRLRRFPKKLLLLLLALLRGAATVAALPRYAGTHRDTVSERASECEKEREACIRCILSSVLRHGYPRSYPKMESLWALGVRLLAEEVSYRRIAWKTRENSAKFGGKTTAEESRIRARQETHSETDRSTRNIHTDPYKHIDVAVARAPTTKRKEEERACCMRSLCVRACIYVTCEHSYCTQWRERDREGRWILLKALENRQERQRHK